jgi:hypothetical protein
MGAVVATAAHPVAKMVAANAHSRLRNFVERVLKRRFMKRASIVVASVDRIAAVSWQGKLTATESQPAAPVDHMRFEALVKLLGVIFLETGRQLHTAPLE